MNAFRRWIASALVTALAVSVSLCPGLAAPAEEAFADFRIAAAGVDKSERSISVSTYHRDDKGGFQTEGEGEYACKLNRATKDASFFIQANAPGVWVSVDYLTDVNGDGVYEYLEDEAAPVWDVMDDKGDLARLEPDDAPFELVQGQPYVLSAVLLRFRGQLAAQERAAEGTFPLATGQDSAVEQEFPLCVIRLHRQSPDGEAQEQTYYLKIYDDILVPFDVSHADWYYDAVAYGLSQGYFSGADNGCFLPNDPLPRAQLAQVLWSMSGSPEAEDSHFSDVSPDDWFYSAVSWCQQENLISGYPDQTFVPNDMLSREQMAAILYRYARYAGTSLRVGGDLSRYPDAGDISPWALDSMRWAVTCGLFPEQEETLRPRDVISRAELAAALYFYTTNAGSRGPNAY